MINVVLQKYKNAVFFNESILKILIAFHKSFGMFVVIFAINNIDKLLMSTWYSWSSNFEPERQLP